MKYLDIIDLDQKIEIMDIGAAAIAETPIYTKLIEEKIANLNAFEGDKRQSDKLKSKYENNVKLYNEFLFDGSIQNLYLAHPESGMTSLFKPNEKVLNFFNGFSKFGKIEKIEKIKTEKLDNISHLPYIDFAKLDIQGSELTVLKNGVKKLENCLAIQLEVSFVCLYEDQPSFGELDLWMRGNGYLPHTFLNIKRWSISPTIFNNNLRQPGNQLLESDIIYIKDPFKLDLLSDTQLKKFILISHYLFKSVDLSVYLILELERRNVLNKNSFKNYITNFKKYS
ncbi:FkbM family methyltransferase [Candidatus Pelagibacter bacterium]|mgnify:CR=1 FL=1|nr:FkbM family methyltransferase [Candidatus Pelagibacter bacterium]MDA9232276.1 FkbM family methyltransferase [Candidatus Pelagibacter sp.]